MMKIKPKLKQLFYMPLGIALGALFVIAVGWYMLKDIYLKFRYHFPDVVRDVLFWVIIIFVFGVIAAIVSKVQKKKKSN